jgi:copper transport protein
MNGSLRRRMARGLIAVGLGLGLVVASAGTASAHAEVESSSPTDGQRLTTAPTQVSILFSEPVTTDLGGVRVVNASGEGVDAGQTNGSGTSTLSVGLSSGLGDDTYVISYRVVSADSHPVKGSIVFTVGNGATADVRSLVSGSAGGDKSFEVLGWLSRFLAYAGGLAAAGLVFFLFFIHDGGPEAAQLARFTRVAAFVGMGGALGTAAAQAALATGRGWSGVFDLSVLHTVLTKNLDWATAVLIGGLALVLLSLELVGTTAQRGLAFYGGLAAVLSFVLNGHPDEASNRRLAILADAVHVSAAAVWLGGLIGLLVVLVRRGRRVSTLADAPGDRPDGGEEDAAAASDPPGPPAVPSGERGGGSTVATRELAPPVAALDAARGTATIVLRFSTTAFVSVLALWIAGGTLAWIELGSREALTGTTYGRLILIKIGIVLIVAVAAAYNRFQLVPTVLDGVDEAEATELDDAATARQALRVARKALRHLRTSVAFEAVAIVVVLGVTAALVNTPPGRATTAGPAVFDQTQPIATGTPGTTVNLVVAPAKNGERAIHISYYDADRRPFDASGPVSVELSLPADQIGPIKRDAPSGGPGHFLIDSIQISPTGTWQIDVVTRLGDFDQQRNTFTMPIT